MNSSEECAMALNFILNSYVDYIIRHQDVIQSHSQEAYGLIIEVYTKAYKEGINAQNPPCLPMSRALKTTSHTLVSYMRYESSRHSYVVLFMSEVLDRLSVILGAALPLIFREYKTLIGGLSSALMDVCLVKVEGY